MVIILFSQSINMLSPLGAFGYFEVTHDITKYCKAAVFSEIGKKTPIGVRFSTVGQFTILYTVILPLSHHLVHVGI